MAFNSHQRWLYAAPDSVWLMYLGLPEACSCAGCFNYRLPTVLLQNECDHQQYIRIVIDQQYLHRGFINRRTRASSSTDEKGFMI